MKSLSRGVAGSLDPWYLRIAPSNGIWAVTGLDPSRVGQYTSP